VLLILFDIFENEKILKIKKIIDIVFRINCDGSETLDISNPFYRDYLIDFINRNVKENEIDEKKNILGNEFIYKGGVNLCIKPDSKLKYSVLKNSLKNIQVILKQSHQY
jgi:hypothetical protein